jgi:hypothetical protein
MFFDNDEIMDIIKQELESIKSRESMQIFNATDDAKVIDDRHFEIVLFELNSNMHGLVVQRVDSGSEGGLVRYTVKESKWK